MFRNMLSLIALGSLIGLWRYEAHSGNDVSDVIFYMLGGISIGMSSEEFTKILAFFKQWPTK